MLTPSSGKEHAMVSDVMYSSSPMEQKVNCWIRGDLIGAGAFGKVNLALNRDNGELFAVKSIECNERMSSERRAIENEVRILQALDSPFVVKCLGSSFSVENGKSMRNVFIEYMPGGSLADLMKKFGGQFEEPLIRNYTRSILEGIQYLHSHHIVHCDIKGRNVLLGNTGVKLADFGGARALGGDSAVMLNSDLLNVKGTPLWMAPEVVQQVEQGPASDIWSLGCTVVEMATGKAPWSEIAGASSPFVALYHIGCTEEVPSLPSCLSEQGQDFLTKCFQRDPNLRWSAAQLLQHPFITDSFSTRIESGKSTETRLQLTSPTSAFDFPSSGCATMTASIVNSVPILRAPLFSKRWSQQEQTTNFFQTEEALVKQGKECTTTSSSCGTDFWCNSPLSPPPGQWITVRTPKTMSPASSPTMSCAPRDLIPNSRVEEAQKPAVAIVAECQKPFLQVRGEIPVVASCTLMGKAVHMAKEEDEDQRECLDIRTEQSSCSGRIAIQSFDRHNKSTEKVEEDNLLPRETGKHESWASGSPAGSHSCLLTTRLDKEQLALTSRLQNRFYPSAASVAAGDLRCTDACGRRRSKLTFGSLRATLRKLALAHRNFPFRCRRKPQIQRLQVHRQLNVMLHRKLIKLGRKRCYFSFGNDCFPLKRIRISL